TRDRLGLADRMTLCRESLDLLHLRRLFNERRLVRRETIPLPASANRPPATVEAREERQDSTRLLLDVRDVVPMFGVAHGRLESLFDPLAQRFQRLPALDHA